MDSITAKYVGKYSERFREFGDSHRALGWTRKERVCVRHRVMADVIRWDYHADSVGLLDFGCGLGHFLTCIESERIAYMGVDVVPEFVDICKTKYPEKDFYLVDVLAGDTLPTSDYTMANGVFTQKLDTPYADMWEYLSKIVGILFRNARMGIAFNVMSSHVDWERKDLFHVPMDLMADFVQSELSPKFIFRNDYGLREYTAYVYH